MSAPARSLVDLRQQHLFESATSRPNGRTRPTRANVTDDTCRVSGDDGVICHVPGYNGAGRNQCAFADMDGQQNGATADRSPVAAHGRLEGPVFGTEQMTIVIGCTRPEIVGEHDAVSDEHLVADIDAFADEAGGLYLAACSDRCAILNFDERPNTGFIPYYAAIEIDQFGLENAYPRAKHH